MPQATTLSLLALVTTLGGIIGTELGRDAVAEIDPVFLSERPVPAVIQEEYQATPASVPTGPGWDYPYDGSRGPVCWGCPGQPDPYLDAYVEPYVDPTDAPIPTSGKAVARMVSEMTEDAVEPEHSSPIERYTSYPVTEDEARRLAHVVELQRPASQAVGM